MTKKDLEKELKSSLSILKSTGFIEREALDFIVKSVEEKLARQDECLSVPRKKYIESLEQRKDRLSDDDLGRFVKKTLWTVSENNKS